MQASFGCYDFRGPWAASTPAYSPAWTSPRMFVNPQTYPPRGYVPWSPWPCTAPQFPPPIPAPAPGAFVPHFAVYSAPPPAALCLPSENVAQTPIWPPEQTALPPVPYNPAPCFFSEPPSVFEAGTFPAQPMLAGIPIRLHPHLIFNPVDPSVPVLMWDIIQAAELARVVGGRSLLVTLDLKASATTPGAKKMYVSSDTPYLEYWMRRWGPILVEKADGIKVRDLLDAIHDYFQKPLTEEDVEALEANSPDNMGRVRIAAGFRIRQSYDMLPAVSASQGLRRSDVLGGLRRFQGMRVVVFGDRTWKVYLSLSMGPVPDLVSGRGGHIRPIL